LRKAYMSLYRRARRGILDLPMVFRIGNDGQILRYPSWISLVVDNRLLASI
jgi:hypothetical protein